MWYSIKKACDIERVGFFGPRSTPVEMNIAQPEEERLITGGYIEKADPPGEMFQAQYENQPVPSPDPMQAAPINGMAQPPQHKGKRGRNPKHGLINRMFRPS